MERRLCGAQTSWDIKIEHCWFKWLKESDVVRVCVCVCVRAVRQHLAWWTDEVWVSKNRKKISLAGERVQPYLRVSVGTVTHLSIHTQPYFASYLSSSCLPVSQSVSDVCVCEHGYGTLSLDPHSSAPISLSWRSEQSLCLSSLHPPTHILTHAIVHHKLI